MGVKFRLDGKGRRDPHSVHHCVPVRRQMRLVVETLAGAHSKVSEGESAMPVKKKTAARTVLPYTHGVIIRSVHHRGMRRLLEDDNPRFLPQDLVDRVRRIVTVLILADHIMGLLPMRGLAGMYTGSPVTGRTIGAFPSPAIGDYI